MVEPRAPELGAVGDVSNPCGEECFPLSKALIVGPNPAEDVDFGEK